MGWAVGFDSEWDRDIGYGVPATCDYPGCGAEINRGLGYVCCNYEAYGGEEGCGLFFCRNHSDVLGKCERCESGEPPFDPTPDTEEWKRHKLQDPTWASWRELHPEAQQQLADELKEYPFVRVMLAIGLGGIVLLFVMDWLSRR